MKKTYLVASLLIIAGAWVLFFTPSEKTDGGLLSSISQLNNNKEDIPGTENENKLEDSPTIEEMAGRMIIVGFRGTNIENSQEAFKMLEEVKPGALILFDRDLPSGNTFPRNIISFIQLDSLLAELKASAKYNLLIAVDAEGGRVNRLNPSYGFVFMPSHLALGSLPKEETYKKSKLLAEQLSGLNIDINFAPVVDVHNPLSPAIGALGRSFSSSPDLVATYAQQYVQAHYDSGVTPVLKHFPGHGSALGDTHKGIVDVTNHWTESELIPYKKLITGGYKGPIMTAHIINRNISPLPATLSSEIITGMLRQQLGFKGVIITDDLQMQAITSQYGIDMAAVMAIKAGADMIIVSNNIGEYDSNVSYKVRDAIVKAVKDGEISRERLLESYLRIQQLNSQDE